MRYAGAGDEPVLRLHPTDAEAAGLADGDRAGLASEHGSMSAVVAVDVRLRVGVASVTHGRSDGGPGELTSSTEGVDPLTGMPLASGLAVSLRPSS